MQGDITQNSLGTQGKERCTWLVAGECVVAFEMVSRVGFPNISLLFLIVLQIWEKTFREFYRFYI